MLNSSGRFQALHQLPQQPVVERNDCFYLLIAEPVSHGCCRDEEGHTGLDAPDTIKRAQSKTSGMKSRIISSKNTNAYYSD